MRERLIDPNVLAGFFLSVVLSCLTLFVFKLVPNGFPILLSNQLSLLKTYVALMNHYMDMVITNQMSFKGLIDVILAKPFTLLFDVK